MTSTTRKEAERDEKLILFKIKEAPVGQNVASPLKLVYNPIREAPRVDG